MTGEYSIFIAAAYGTTALILTWIVIVSILRWRKTRTQLGIK
jgi:heme exporter protein CcmD